MKIIDNVVLKECRICHTSKPRTEFTPRRAMSDGLRSECKPCRTLIACGQRARRVRSGNTKDQDRSRKWRAENIERHRALCRKWGKENLGKVLSYKRERYKSNAEIRLRQRFGHLVWRSLRGGKARQSSMRMVDYSMPELIAHLEKQFTKGMTLENYGTWHVDHIVPLSSFTINTPEDDGFKRAWALTNLRPLWASENVRKSDKRVFLL